MIPNSQSTAPTGEEYDNNTPTTVYITPTELYYTTLTDGQRITDDDEIWYEPPMWESIIWFVPNKISLKQNIKIQPKITKRTLFSKSGYLPMRIRKKFKDK